MIIKDKEIQENKDKDLALNNGRNKWIEDNEDRKVQEKTKNIDKDLVQKMKSIRKSTIKVRNNIRGIENKIKRKNIERDHKYQILNQKIKGRDQYLQEGSN